MGQLKRIINEYPHRNSPVVCAFEAEIKRMSIEKGLSMEQVLEKLAKFSGVTARNLYHYRSGKTDIPSSLIPKFCKQFRSNALAMAIVAGCNETQFDERDSFDLTRFCSRTVQDTLKHGENFLEAFDDGIIDGHELSRLELGAAKVILNANRLLEIARAHYDRRHAAPEAA